MRVALAIKSCHRYADRRAAQVATWLQEWPHEYVFLIGQPTHRIPNSLCCQVSDAFENIAPKIVCACLWALESNYEHLVLADDDTYLRPDKLLLSGFEKQDYMGHLRVGNLGYNENCPYAQGHCYTLSARAMELIVASPLMVGGVIDDGAVGRVLVERVPFCHDRRFSPGPDFLDAVRVPGWISAHKVLPKHMQEIHQWRKRG